MKPSSIGSAATKRARLAPHFVASCAIAVVLILLALAGCGSEQSTDITGYWQGSGQEQGLVIRIDHSGDSYTVAGMSGPDMPVTLKDDEIHLAGGVVGSLSADGKTLTLRNVRVPGSQIIMTRPTASTRGACRTGRSPGRRFRGHRGRHRDPAGDRELVGRARQPLPGGRGGAKTDEAFAALVTPWPSNPFTGAPMVPGSQPGEYTYAIDGKSFTLVAHLTGGRVVEASSRPSPAP